MIRRKRVNGYRHFVWVSEDGRERVLPRARVLAWIEAGEIVRGKRDGCICYRRVKRARKEQAA